MVMRLAIARVSNRVEGAWKRAAAFLHSFVEKKCGDVYSSSGGMRGTCGNSIRGPVVHNTECFGDVTSA
jgi:hypothetical protein